MKRRMGVLVLGSLLAWAVVAYPARILWGDAAIVYSVTAVALCLVPTVGTLAWGGWALDQTPEQQLLMVLGGTGVRMAFVLGVGLLLYVKVPGFGDANFWIWVLAFYLLTLALEMVLLVAGRSNPGKDQKQVPANSLQPKPD